ncbi:MAG: glycosyltransferase family 2 protein [Mongoliitalea sp.]
MIEILLPTYNGEKYIDQQIVSLNAQSYQNWRILTRDDGSKDKTKEIILKWKAILGHKLIIYNEFNDVSLGVNKNFSFLMDKSTASYVMLCDQDDYWLPNKIEKSLIEIKKMEGQKEVNVPLMACCDSLIVDENLNLMHKSFWHLRKDDPSILSSFEKLVAQSVVTGNTIILNRSALEVCTPINTNFFLFDQWISIKVAYYGQIKFIPEALIKYRQHSQNVLGSYKVTFGYLISKIKYFPFYVTSWFKLKKDLNLNFSLSKVIWFKINYNIKRLIR